jgi:hypothetical protein
VVYHKETLDSRLTQRDNYAMRRIWLSSAVLATGCSFSAAVADFDASTIDGNNIDAADVDAAAIDARVDAPPDAAARLLWVQDTQSDFAPGVNTGVVVTPWNTVEPKAFAAGWLLRGKAGSAFDNENALNFATLSDETSRALITDTAFNGFQSPSWILNVTDPFTVWTEAEMFLSAGQHRFAAACDDRAVLSIQLTAADVFTNVVSCNFTNGTQQSDPVDIVADGYYPIRLAWTDALGFSSLALTHRGPNDSGFAPIAGNDMRTDVTFDSSANSFGFDQIGMTQAVGTRLWSAPVITQNFGRNAVPGLEISNGNTWSTRWLGQVRLEATGMYSFAIASNGGHRLIVDGTRLAETAFVAPASSTTTATLLAAGWHDMALDLHVAAPTNAAPAAIGLQVAAGGPEFAGMSIPMARIRPVSTGSERLASAADNNSAGIAAQSELVRTIAPPNVPADAVITGVDVSYRAIPANNQTLAVSLEHGSVTASVGQGGDATVTLSAVDFNNSSASGPWILRITNNNNRGAAFRTFAVTVHYRTAEQPSIATQTSYESQIHDFGSTVNVDSIAWTSRQAVGNAIVMEARSCATSCSSEPYKVVANGAAPGLVEGRYVQYRVALVSDGIVVPALDKVTFTATAR